MRIYFVVLLFLAMGCSVIGKKPSGDHLKKISLSPNWDKNRQKFKNRNQKAYDQMIKDFDYWAMTKNQFFGKEIREPKTPLPIMKPDLRKFLTLDFAYIWLGHSTILLRLEGKTILFDPIFTNAGPISFIGKRFAPPSIKLNELPKIDYIFISHDHYDHLDYETILHFVDKKETKFYTPLGVSSYLVGWGVDPSRVMEFDWWDQVQLDGIKAVCTPSQHFSGRAGMQANPTLWASWSILGKKKKVFFSGDSGYDIHFKEIGKRLGPFDLIFMENGQYNEIWYMSHLRPAETIKAYEDMGALGVLQPIHWGMFNLAPHDWFEPIEKTLEYTKNKNYLINYPKVGEIVHQSHWKNGDFWWR